MSVVSEINSSQRFSLDEIEKATNDFNVQNVVGEGGFGKVYKGVVDDGSTHTLVAVKRLSTESKQGLREFETEIKMLSKCRHCNLVNLLGYCHEHQELILVYEYMSQGSLADHLYGNQGSSLTWKQRLKICIGAARGLEYLHTGTGLDAIIHLDVKSDNILLDDNWAAKIADLGLSKTGHAHQLNSEVNTVHIRGTPGYMDPRYLETLKYSRKADVYSFGVVLLEVLSGTSVCGDTVIPNSEALDRASWIQKHISNETLDQIIDSRIASEIQPESLKRIAYTASKSLQRDPKKRPSMSVVVALLESASALQSSSPLDKDDPFQFNFEGETSRWNSIPELLGKVHNIFGENIRTKTMEQMGLDPTRENKARVAYDMMYQNNKYDEALRFVNGLKEKWGNAISTLGLIYNATGETLRYVTSRNHYGDIATLSYPLTIQNGEWGAFMHTKTPMMPTGSVDAVVYRGRYSDIAYSDRMITWFNRVAHDNSAYCEINMAGHFDDTNWDAIFNKAKGMDTEGWATWKNCCTLVKIENDASAIFKVFFTLVGVPKTALNVG